MKGFAHEKVNSIKVATIWLRQTYMRVTQFFLFYEDPDFPKSLKIGISHLG